MVTLEVVKGRGLAERNTHPGRVSETFKSSAALNKYTVQASTNGHAHWPER